MRKTFIGGNWKMQASASKVSEIVAYLNSLLWSNVDREVVVAPSFVFLQEVRKELSLKFGVAAQNCCTEEIGAFTGEKLYNNSAKMIKDIGLSWVILGHSERRTLYDETDTIVCRKIATALKNELNIIACVGETLQQRESGETETVLLKQSEAIISKYITYTYTVDDWSKIVIAYEPVWAIGTGIVATPEQAQTAHAYIRSLLKKNVSKDVADTTRIIYGGTFIMNIGSVKADNVEDLSKQSDIDGFLVGGASLTKDFGVIMGCT